MNELKIGDRVKFDKEIIDVLREAISKIDEQGYEYEIEKINENGDLYLRNFTGDCWSWQTGYFI